MKEREADIAGGSGPREGFLCLQKAGGCLKASGRVWREREAGRMGVRWEEQVGELTCGRGLEPWRRGEWGWKAGGDFRADSREVPGKLLLQEVAEVIC